MKQKGKHADSRARIRHRSSPLVWRSATTILIRVAGFVPLFLLFLELVSPEKDFIFLSADARQYDFDTFHVRQAILCEVAFEVRNVVLVQAN